MTHKITINQIAKVGKAPDTLAKVPEMLDTPPILKTKKELNKIKEFAAFVKTAFLHLLSTVY